LDFEKFVLKPAAPSRASESRAFILKDDAKLLPVKSSVRGRITEIQFNQEDAICWLSAIMNRDWDLALDVARAEAASVQRECSKLLGGGVLPWL
jgi:hypothetical protein